LLYFFFFLFFWWLNLGARAGDAINPAKIQSLRAQAAEAQSLREQLAEAQSKCFTLALCFSCLFPPADKRCCAELVMEVDALK
jgi:hypothetical protein